MNLLASQGGGHLPNFCTRVCKRGLRHPFSCNFFVKNMLFSLQNSAKTYPFMNKITEKFSRIVLE